MKLDRSMVNLFFEIKRSLLLEQQKIMLVSSPNLGEIMANLYQTTQNENIKLLTEVFLERSANNWRKKAPPKKIARAALAKLFNNGSIKEITPIEQVKKNKTQLIYRGQIVEN